jgi:hypothetical protein
MTKVDTAHPIRSDIVIPPYRPLTSGKLPGEYHIEARQATICLDVNRIYGRVRRGRGRIAADHLAQLNREGGVWIEKLTDICSLIAPRPASRLREEADSADNCLPQRLRALRLSDEA